MENFKDKIVFQNPVANGVVAFELRGPVLWASHRNGHESAWPTQAWIVEDPVRILSILKKTTHHCGVVKQLNNEAATGSIWEYPVIRDINDGCIDYTAMQKTENIEEAQSKPPILKFKIRGFREKY